MSENATSLRANSIAAIACGLVAVYATGMINAWSPCVRFVSPLANSVTFAVMQLIPMVLFVLAILTGSWWARLLRAIAIVPIVAHAILFGSCAALDSASTMADGTDRGFEKINATSLPSGRLAIYRTNGGATTSFGIVVRHECALLPGLLRVRNVWSVYPGYEADAQLLGGNLVRLSSPPDGKRRP